MWITVQLLLSLYLGASLLLVRRPPYCSSRLRGTVAEHGRSLIPSPCSQEEGGGGKKSGRKDYCLFFVISQKFGRLYVDT